ncbi:hypothetical protein C3L33_07797, partial [Rhododendron williamsianum]
LALLIWLRNCAGTAGFENMATVALVSNLVTYLTQVMHFDISDAANQVTNFLGTGYILSIPIAAIADMYTGRPKSVYVVAFRNRNLQLPEDPEELYEINRDMEAAPETEFLPHRDFYK